MVLEKRGADGQFLGRLGQHNTGAVLISMHGSRDLPNHVLQLKSAKFVQCWFQSYLACEATFVSLDVGQVLPCLLV